MDELESQNELPPRARRAVFSYEGVMVICFFLAVGARILTNLPGKYVVPGILFISFLGIKVVERPRNWRAGLGWAILGSILIFVLWNYEPAPRRGSVRIEVVAPESTR